METLNYSLKGISLKKKNLSIFIFEASVVNKCLDLKHSIISENNSKICNNLKTKYSVIKQP